MRLEEARVAGVAPNVSKYTLIQSPIISCLKRSTQNTRTKHSVEMTDVRKQAGSGQPQKY